MIKNLSIFLLILGTACTMAKSNSGEKKAQDPEHLKMSGEIVEHQFIKKNGEPADFTELYFRASVQDYFIKFCESSVSLNELKPFVDKVVTIEAEIKNGHWDICPGDEQEAQSRVGYYIVVKKLF